MEVPQHEINAYDALNAFYMEAPGAPRSGQAGSGNGFPRKPTGSLFCSYINYTIIITITITITIELLKMLSLSALVVAGSYGGQYDSCRFSYFLKERVSGSGSLSYTRSPLEDSRLFGPSPWKVLAATNEQNDF